MLNRVRGPLEKQTIIHALIPCSEGEAVVNWRGEMPQRTHEAGSGTYEETLVKLGRETLGIQFLDVQSRDTSFSNVDGYNHIVYRVNATCNDITPAFHTYQDTPTLRRQGILKSFARVARQRVKLTR